MTPGISVSKGTPGAFASLFLLCFAFHSIERARGRDGLVTRDGLSSGLK